MKVSVLPFLITGQFSLVEFDKLMYDPSKEYPWSIEFRGVKKSFEKYADLEDWLIKVFHENLADQKRGVIKFLDTAVREFLNA